MNKESVIKDYVGFDPSLAKMFKIEEKINILLRIEMACGIVL